jgi:DNA polymerase III delta prime subunit
LGYSDGLSTLSTGRDKPLKVKKTDSDDSDDIMYKNPGQAGERNIGNVFRKVRVLDISEIDEFKALELYQKINEYVDKNDQNIFD